MIVLPITGNVFIQFATFKSYNKLRLKEFGGDYCMREVENRGTSVFPIMVIILSKINKNFHLIR